MVEYHNDWDPTQVPLVCNDTIPDSWKICILEGVFQGQNEYNGSLGARISSIFVIFFVSTFLTLFPILARQFPKLKIPLYGYLFARYFGTGVIVATAFVHLLDPAYGTLGPNTCVGMTGNWAVYSWPPAIVLTAVFAVFLIDVVCQVVVERQFGLSLDHDADVEGAIVRSPPDSHVHGTSGDCAANLEMQLPSDKKKPSFYYVDEVSLAESEIMRNFKMEFGAFLMLEFGIIFHSVMIGLSLGAAGDEFKTLYIVLVFHQSFEGLGIGARLSAITFPADYSKWIPYFCCLAYGFVTPISIAIGLGVRTTYMDSSYNANIIQGVLNSISAGILIYNGLVALLARDFIFDRNRTKDLKRLTFMIAVTLLGAGIMSLLGKWA